MLNKDSQIYLYIFEDGTIKQSQLAPTSDDRACILDGILQVITLVGGKFVDTRIVADKLRFEDIPEINH